MPYTKRFELGTVKMNGVATPQTFPAATSWSSAPIPCRGARGVVFTCKATDANVPASFAVNVTNDPAGTGQQSAAGANGYNVRGVANVAMNGGGLIIAGFHADAMCPHGFMVLSLTSHATNPHTAFQVTAEVFYNGDAEAMRQDVNQYTTL